MRRLYLALPMLLAAGGGAFAAGYDDFSKGVAAYNRGDNDLAISALTAALGDGDLNPSFLPIAHLDRGIAYALQEKCREGADDISTAIKLGLTDPQIYRTASEVSSCAGDMATALADIDIVIAKSPSVDAYFVRGRIHWDAGEFAAATSDLEQAASLDPENAYAALWMEMMHLRAGTLDPAQVKRDTEHLDSDWPAPVFDLYAGRLQPADIMAAAVRSDRETLAGRQCEANFYVAEWWLARRVVDTARPLLEQAKASCPRGYIEYSAAVTELKRLQ